MTVTNLYEFKADLKKFAKEVNLDVAKVRRRIALDVFRRVTRKSPVGNPDLWQHPVPGYVGGRFRASWALSDTTPLDYQAPEKAAVYAAQGPVTATFAQPFDTAWVVNSLPYAQALEFGHSQQAPFGMVRIALAEVETEMASAHGRP